MDDNKIEEMRQVIQNASCKGIECEKCWLKNSPTCVCVKALYNEGYRKESDTAREILDEVSKHFGGKWLVDLYKKYGLDWDKEIE